MDDKSVNAFLIKEIENETDYPDKKVILKPIRKNHLMHLINQCIEQSLIQDDYLLVQKTMYYPWWLKDRIEKDGKKRGCLNNILSLCFYEQCLLSVQLQIPELNQVTGK